VQKSIGENVIPDGWSFEKGLALIKKAGFDGVELWLGDKSWFKMDTSDAGVRELLRKVHEAGLTVSNVANSFDWHESSRPAIRECRRPRGGTSSGRSKRPNCWKATPYWWSPGW